MQVAVEELQDLKGVWGELSKIWEQIDELKDKPWLSVQPRKVHQIFSASLRNYDMLLRCTTPNRILMLVTRIKPNLNIIDIFQFYNMNKLNYLNTTHTHKCKCFNTLACEIQYCLV